MKAVVLESFGDASHFVLKDVPIPEPKEGEVRIRIKCAAFNPVDYKMRLGWYGGQLPLILGADCSGVIDSVGKGVHHLSIDDEVYAMPFGSCSNGSYAEYLTLPAAFVAKKPKNFSFEQAAAVPLVGMTAYRALIASNALKEGASVFIAGAGGGVGSIAVALAKHHHCNIFTVAGSKESAAFLSKELNVPPKNILLYTSKTPEQLTEAFTQLNGGLFATTFDCVGGDMKKLCLNLTEHSGHFSSVLSEHPPFAYSVWDRSDTPCFNRNISIHCIFVGAEAFSGPPSSWQIYTDHLSHLTTLFETASIAPPATTLLGPLSVETVRKAHLLLEEGRVKGKLIMKNN